MPSTYTPIATQTLGSAAASVTFSSIPSTYTDLIVVINGAVTSGTANCNFQLNGDTSTNYSRTALSGTGSAANSSRFTGSAYGMINDYGYLDTTYRTNMLAQFMNYSNATTFKTVLARSNNSDNGTAATVTLWRSTAAISTIYLYASSSTFITGSTFTLYGIKAA